jgi:hypothetical protein
MLRAACLAEKQEIPILVFCLTRRGLEPMIYHTRGRRANHYATDVVPSFDEATLLRSMNGKHVFALHQKWQIKFYE